MSSTTTRWTFSQETELGTDTWTMPMNPYEASSPYGSVQGQGGKALTFGVNASSSARTVQATPKPLEWTWSGYIRSQEHHEALEAWAKRSGLITVSDHLGQRFEVMLVDYQPQDRSPTPRVPWRMEYSMKAMILREVT